MKLNLIINKNITFRIGDFNTEKKLIVAKQEYALNAEILCKFLVFFYVVVRGYFFEFKVMSIAELFNLFCSFELFTESVGPTLGGIRGK